MAPEPPLTVPLHGRGASAQFGTPRPPRRSQKPPSPWQAGWCPRRFPVRLRVAWTAMLRGIVSRTPSFPARRAPRHPRHESAERAERRQRDPQGSPILLIKNLFLFDFTPAHGLRSIHAPSLDPHRSRQSAHAARPMTNRFVPPAPQAVLRRRRRGGAPEGRHPGAASPPPRSLPPRPPHARTARPVRRGRQRRRVAALARGSARACPPDHRRPLAAPPRPGLTVLRAEVPQASIP